MSDRDELKVMLSKADPETGAYDLDDYTVYWGEFADNVLASDWLARVKREAKSEAWDEGARWAYEELTGKPEGGHWLLPEENPYREDSE